MAAAAPAPPPNLFGYHQWCTPYILPFRCHLCTTIRRNCCSRRHRYDVSARAHRACCGSRAFDVCRDGLTSFFGDQNFEYDGYILPQVSHYSYIEHA